MAAIFLLRCYMKYVDSYITIHHHQFHPFITQSNEFRLPVVAVHQANVYIFVIGNMYNYYHMSSNRKQAKRYINAKNMRRKMQTHRAHTQNQLIDILKRARG